MIKVHLVGDTLLTGIGINPGLNAKGEVCVCRNAEEAAKKFINWWISPNTQKAIASFQLEGKQLFFPNAKAGK